MMEASDWLLRNCVAWVLWETADLASASERCCMSSRLASFCFSSLVRLISSSCCCCSLSNSCWRCSCAKENGRQMRLSGRASFWGDAYTVRNWVDEEFAYQRKEVEKRMTHFKSTFTTGFTKRFSKIKYYSQTMHAFLTKQSRAFRESCLMSSLRRVKTDTRFFSYAARIHDFAYS